MAGRELAEAAESCRSGVRIPSRSFNNPASQLLVFLYYLNYPDRIAFSPQHSHHLCNHLVELQALIFLDYLFDFCLELGFAEQPEFSYVQLPCQITIINYVWNYVL